MKPTCNKNTRALWQKYWLFKNVILKMNRKWTSVNTCCIFASFDTYSRCYTVYKNGNLMYIKWMKGEIEFNIWYYCFLDIFGNCRLRCLVARFEELLLLSFTTNHFWIRNLFGKRVLKDNSRLLVYKKNWKSYNIKKSYIRNSW